MALGNSAKGAPVAAATHASCHGNSTSTSNTNDGNGYRDDCLSLVPDIALGLRQSPSDLADASVVSNNEASAAVTTTTATAAAASTIATVTATTSTLAPAVNTAHCDASDGGRSIKAPEAATPNCKKGAPVAAAKKKKAPAAGGGGGCCGGHKHSHAEPGAKAGLNPEMLKRLSGVLSNIKAGGLPGDVSATKQKEKKLSDAAANDDLGEGLQRIEKRILALGRGVPNSEVCRAPGGGFVYPTETKFIFHYQIRRLNSDRTVLDDTRKYGRTMELYSGKQFQMDFWESCLGTMQLNEVASFTVPVERLAAFPAVNKKLRDYMLDKTSGANGGAKHCCGLMSMQEQGGLGYEDLDQLMQKPEPLEFIFDLVSVDLPGEKRKEVWLMTPEEKEVEVPRLKSEGARFYAMGDWHSAASRYTEALNMLEQLVLREKPGDPDWLAIEQLRVPFFVNMAQCQFKLKDYYGAINSASEALSRDSNHVKALYRRGKAYAATWDMRLAEADLRRVAELEPKMALTVAADLAEIQSNERAQGDRQRRLLAGRINLSTGTDTAANVDAKSKMTAKSVATTEIQKKTEGVVNESLAVGNAGERREEPGGIKHYTGDERNERSDTDRPSEGGAGEKGELDKGGDEGQQE